MPKEKSKRKVSDKMLGIMIGIALTISAIGVAGIASVSYAHSRDTNNMMNSDMMGGMMDDQDNMMGDGMMSGDMSMMHSMMMGDSSGVMKNHMQMTQEEIDEMIKDMDKDGDGLCDYCGMPVSMCRKMIGS